MKIRYSLLILLLIISTSIAITAILGTNLIKEQASEIADIENPKLKASTEMEVDLNQITNSIFAVMENRPQLSEIDKNIADYDRFREEYATFPLTSNEKESLVKLDALTLQFGDITNQLILAHTEKQEKSLERNEIFDGSIREILIQTLKPDLDPSEPQYDIKAQALNEIDINIHVNPRPFLLDIITEAISELRLFTTQFDQAELAENQRDLFDVLKPDIESIITLAEEIIELEGKRLALLEEFDRSFAQIDTVLDREIQASSTTKIQAATELEVELTQTVNAIFAIMEQRPQISDIDQDIADYLRHREQYSSLIQTDLEKEELVKLDTLFLQYEVIGTQLIDVHTEKQEKSHERIDIFDGSVRDILIQTLKPDLDPSEPQYDIKAQALNEIDINIHEIISASRGYQINPEPFLKDIITEAISELRFFTTQFDQAELAENQRDLFDLLKPDIESIITLTEEIIDLEDSRLALLIGFDSSRLKIDKLLDQEIQAIALQHVQEGQERTKNTIDQILIALVVIFIIMLVSGFVYSFRLGHRTEKLIDVTTEIVKGNYEVKAPTKQTDEIGILGKALNEMSSKLKAANLQQEQFAAMITHELKTPLVPIKGYCEMLLNPKFGEISQDQKEAVEEILQNATQLQALIQNVLSAQKLGVDAMKYNIEDIDVDEYIEQIFKTLTPYMTDKKINFTKSVQEGTKIRADKSKLVEVFTNIVQNSVDFVPDVDGKITIGGISKGKQIQFSITDNGIGMPKEKQKKLFQKFYQVDTSHTRKHGGSGLGLSICKGYIEDMHGKIWIESEEDKGTTIFFTLPMV